MQIHAPPNFTSLYCTFPIASFDASSPRMTQMLPSSPWNLFSLLHSGLLRLTELEGGVISIDGIDVSAVGLNALR
jgi:hypothetical protein